MNHERLFPWVKNKYVSRRDWIVSEAGRLFIDYKPEAVWKYLTWGTAGCFLIGLFLTWPYSFLGLPVGFALTVGLFEVPRILIENKIKTRIRKFTVQLVDALTLMANALRSGLNIPQAVQLVSEEMPQPISQEFGLILREQKVGVPLEEALEALARRLPSDDIDMFVTSVVILRETGGNLAETFDTITHTIRERLKLEQKISAMVSQGVVQGTIMVLLPFGLAIMMYVINPKQVAMMFTTPVGLAILAFMLFLQSLGAWAIWKIINVKV